MMDENNQEVIREAKIEDLPEKEKDKKIKNLTALAILLGGLFVGSLFVDLIQLVSGQGFSSRKLQQAGVLESGGKTWVAYDQPILKVKVFSSDNCESCKTDEILVWLKKILPTIEAEKIDVDSEEGKKAASGMEIKTIPGIVFSKEIVKTDFFEKAKNVFIEKNGSYVLNGSEIGVPVGKYLELPLISEKNAKIGSDDALVKLIEFSDFQCPYCKVLHESVKQILAEMGDKVQLVYKNLPLDFHAQAKNAALAAACANEQGKFESYADKLFSSQNDWGSTKGTARFKTYAFQLGLSGSQFNQCLDEGKFEELIKEDMAEADKFSITGTPAIFINGQFKNGAVSFPELKAIIEEELKNKE